MHFLNTPSTSENVLYFVCVIGPWWSYWSCVLRILDSFISLFIEKCMNLKMFEALVTSIIFVRRTLTQTEDQTNSIEVCHFWMQTVDNVSLVLSSPNNFVDTVYFTLRGVPISHIHLLHRWGKWGGWVGSAHAPIFVA